MIGSVILMCSMAVAMNVHSAELDDGYWTVEQARPILEKTHRVHLSPSLDSLNEGERVAVQKLLEVGVIMQRLYEDSLHPDALAAYDELVALEHTEAERVDMLLDLYRLSRGPIVTTLENERKPFLPVSAETPGKNVYPIGIEREEVDSVLSSNPALRDSLLHLRSVVRRSNPENLYNDLLTLQHNPALSVLHPGLQQELSTIQASLTPQPLYALPYSVAYADDLLRSHNLLHDAASSVTHIDPAFARFLRNRARDFLTDHYESGDASWVTGRFQNLNAQIGSYETYNDQLFGVKTFFSLSLLLRDRERTAELATAVRGLQDFDDALPYESSRQIRNEIPIGVYNVVADFGQSRSANTATILPNESFLARQYGRTILLRGNILTHPRIFAVTKASFEAAIHESQHADLTQEANLYRTLWHEIGHYLGVDLTDDGRDLGVALGDAANLYEEMKSDLVSLHSVRQLVSGAFLTKAQGKAMYASGIRRVLQKTRPRRDQAYQTMQLMQWNWFLENGVLKFDKKTGTLLIDYDRYHRAVRSLLAEVLKIQSDGDQVQAESFIEQWTTWDDELHGIVSGNMKAREVYRYTLVTYESLGDTAPRTVSD